MSYLDEHKLTYDRVRRLIEEKKTYLELTQDQKNEVRLYFEDSNKFFLEGLSPFALSQFNEFSLDLEKFASISSESDIRTYSKRIYENGYSGSSREVFLGVEDLFDLAVLDGYAQEELGIDPSLFIHNCDVVTAEKDKMWFRSVFIEGLENAKTIHDLLKINNHDFRYIPNLRKENGKRVVSGGGGPYKWFGKENFHSYREMYLKKFTELANVASFDDLWEALECFKRYSFVGRRDDWSSRLDFDKISPDEISEYGCIVRKKYEHYHRAKKRSELGLPNGSFLPLYADGLSVLIRLSWQHANFEQCHRIYRLEAYRSLGEEALHQLSSLAQTPDEHFIVASIAYSKGSNFRELWSKHVIQVGKVL